MNNIPFRVGDVIQITDPEHSWYPCLLIVDEVKSWGVQAYAFIPKTNDGSEKAGLAFNRLKFGQIAYVGMSAVMTVNDEAQP